MQTRNTKTKQLVTTTLQQSLIPLSLDSIFTEVKRVYPATAYSTIYRIVQALLADNKVEQLDWKHRGSVFEWAHREHHHHVQCDTCGKITDIDDESLGLSFTTVTKKTGFVINTHSIELRGLCAPCQGTKKESAHA